MKTIIIILIFLVSTNCFSYWKSINRSGYPLAYKNTVYIINDGVYFSEDEGINWVHFNWGSFPYTFNQYSYFVGNDRNLILPSRLFDNYSKSVFVSNDNGKTFVENDFSTVNNGFKSAAYSDYVSVAAPVQNLVVISDDGQSLFVSFDDGKTWEDNRFKFVQNNSNGESTFIENSTILSAYFTKSTLFVGGNRGLYKLVKHPMVQDSVFVSVYDNIPKDSGIWNIVDIAGNDNLLYIILTKGNHVGHPPSKLLKSSDKGETWELIDTEKYGLDKIKYVYSCDDYLYAIQKDKGLFKSSDQGQSWEELNLYYENGQFKRFTFPERLQFGNNFAYIIDERRVFQIELYDCEIRMDYSSVINDKGLYVFPNPVKDIIRLSTNIPLKLELYDIFGNKVLEDTNTQLNIQHLNIGTYYLKYGNETKLIIKY